MGGIAQIAKQKGFKVTGCDANVYPPMSDQLRESGIELTEGYDASQINLNPDIYVIGNAVSRGNPLLEAILNKRLPYTSGPAWLEENILCGKKVLAVAGTHGKTTTTSMLIWILQKAGLNPSYLVGGVPENFGHSARLTDSDYFVIEADEYDTAFFDKRSKFVHYRPTVAILNNLEYDHADIFPNIEAIERQFHHLVRTIPSNGRIIYNHASQTLKKVLEMGCWTPCESFGFEEGADWQLKKREGLRVCLGGKELGELNMDFPGEHNQLNALAAIGAASAVGVNATTAIDALSEFRGVKRRMEVKGVVNSVTVIDDFAHHPTAILETIKAVRSHYPQSRLIAVLEPRSNTMKMGSMKSQLPESLNGADLVFCYQSPAVQWDVAEAMTPIKNKCSVYKELDEVVQGVVAASQKGDVILVMSNGGFAGIHEKLLKSLKNKG